MTSEARVFTLTNLTDVHAIVAHTAELLTRDAEPLTVRGKEGLLVRIVIERFVEKRAKFRRQLLRDVLLPHFSGGVRRDQHLRFLVVLRVMESAEHHEAKTIDAMTDFHDPHQLATDFAALDR